MSGPPRSIDEAIDTRLATIAFPSARIAFLNATYQPKAGVPYLRAQMVSRTRVPITLGVDAAILPQGGYMVRWDGVYEVTAVWPQNAGIDGCGEMQAQILRLFPRGTTLTDSGGLRIIFDAPDAPPIRPDDAWVRGAVRCPWFCFEAT